MIKKIRIDTIRYAVKATSKFPSIYDTDGCYPYTQFSKTAEIGKAINLEAFKLENDLIEVIVCPKINGRVLSLVDKKTGKEALYRNDVIKPNRILPRWGWFSGGIEFNFPIAHSPTAMEEISYKIFKTKNRVSIQVGETERKYGLSWVVEISLGKKENFITQRTWFKNFGSLKRPWTYWTNAATRSTRETKYLFPHSDNVLRHANVVDKIKWPDFGSKEKDFDRMTGLFWKSDGYAFGIWHPEEEIGLLHLADPKIVNGMKMWTYGIGKHSKWPQLFTDTGLPYGEIQSGAVADQSEELFLQPNEEKYFIEFWKPVTNLPEISNEKLPKPNGIFPEVNWFSNEHIPELKMWNNLKNNYKTDSSLYQISPTTPPPPLPEYEVPLRTAYKKDKELWRGHLAIYLITTQEFAEQYLKQKFNPEEIIEILKDAKTATELRTLGLTLWKKCSDPNKGAEKLMSANKLSNDVQLAYELDACLTETNDIESREKLFNEYKSEDTRWIERKIDFLISNNKEREALNLMMNTKWDMYHLRQNRTKLFKRIMKILGKPNEPIPEKLGEDDMAEWGAYRPQNIKKN